MCRCNLFGKLEVMAKDIVPFGHWLSPIDGAMVAGKSRRFGQLLSSNGWVWWSEARPEENGRSVLMRIRPGDGAAPEMMLPAPWSAISRVHEYGGGEFCVSGDDVFFVNSDDQDIYRLSGGEVRRVTDEPATRFADIQHDTVHGRLFCVAERKVEGQDHPDNLPDNLIVSIALGDGAISDAVTGHDFFGQLRLSPDGRQLAWIAWDLPDMPWDQAELYVGSVAAAGLCDVRKIAGGRGVAIFQPEWSGTNQLYFVSDAAGHGQLQRFDGTNIEVVNTGGGELSRPLWSFGMRVHARTGAGDTGAAAFVDGVSVFTRNGIVVETGLAQIDDPVAVGDGYAVHAAFHDAPPAIVHLDDVGAITVLRRSADIDLDPSMVSHGEIVHYPGAGGEDVVAIYYPPRNAEVAGPPDELPPAIVTAHGGPTGMAARGLKLKTQYWTSRGFAVFDVDYSGSSGYGRAYRERLDGQWGIRDVADVIAGARFLGSTGRADPARLAISGGSAGGYTVLMALATSDIFAAGGCHYGISDIAQLHKFTHKFEAGYLYRLMGVGPDDWRETFSARSPLNLVDRMTSPAIFFQGADDAVVPPAQSRMMVDALRAKGVPVAYHEFEGERHGFRKAETIATVLAAELVFFREHLGLGS